MVLGAPNVIVCIYSQYNSGGCIMGDGWRYAREDDNIPSWRRPRLTAEQVAEQRAAQAERQRQEDEARERQRLRQEQEARSEHRWKTIGWTAYAILTLSTWGSIILGVSTHPEFKGWGKFLVIYMVVNIVIWVAASGSLLIG
jgi:hypothetical protein